MEKYFSTILYFTFYILHLKETRSTSRLGYTFAASLRVTGEKAERATYPFLSS